MWRCNTMWHICQDSELATAINYQQGFLGASNTPAGRGFCLCARYHIQALRSLMTPLTYTLKDGERQREQVPPVASDMLFAELLKYEPGTRIFSNSLPEFPVSANVGEECLQRSGRKPEPRDYQFMERCGVQAAYRNWICRHHPDWSFKHIHCCGKTDFAFSSIITHRCPSVMLNFWFNSPKK